MPPNILPSEPLTQVIFVHDYVQLVFQEEIFSLYNRLSVQGSGSTVVQGEQGFADALVGLIGEAAVMVDQPTGCALRIQFEHGSSLYVLSGNQDVRGAEAFQFERPSGLLVVEQNQ